MWFDRMIPRLSLSKRQQKLFRPPELRCLQGVFGLFTAGRAGRPSAHMYCRQGLTRTIWLAMVLWLGFFLPADTSAEDGGAPLLATKLLLLDGAVAGSRLIVVGERGHILVSSDEGESWSRAQVPTRVLLTAVHMHDAHTGWAVGHDAVILRTVDGGESWAIVHAAPEEERPLLDVWFRDARAGFAVGAYGYFLVTVDAGETWTSRSISADDFHLNAVIPVAGREPGSQRLYIAAEAGVAYRSDDGGETWRELSTPYAGSWFGGLALDENRVLLVGLRGHMFRSGDGGDTWEEVVTGIRATLTGAVRLQSGLVVITGLEEVVLTSRDNGQSVSHRRLMSRAGISTALPRSDGSVLLIGEFGVKRMLLDE